MRFRGDLCGIIYDSGGCRECRRVQTCHRSKLKELLQLSKNFENEYQSAVYSLRGDRNSLYWISIECISSYAFNRSRGISHVLSLM